MASPGFGRLGGLFPPVGSQYGFAERRGRGEEEERKSYVIPWQTVAQGRIEAENQRAQNLIPLEMSVPDYGNLRDAYVGVTKELQDTEISKDPAWWQRALGKLEYLKYMEIPAELLAEAVLDPISMVTGKQMSALRGEAPREQFEGWKALFGSDTSEATGWREFKSRLDIAGDAFEKRPLKMQLGMGLLQIIATGGTGALVKGAAVGGSKARLLAKAARTGSMIVDPYEAVFRGIGKGVGKMRTTRKPHADKYDKEMVDIDADGTKYYPNVERERIKEVFDTAKYSNWEDGVALLGQEVFRRGSLRYGLAGSGRQKEIRPYFFDRSTIPPILERGNTLRVLMAEDFEIALNKRKQYEALSNASNTDRISKLEEVIDSTRDLALISMSLGMDARPYEVGRVTYKQLSDFIDTNQLVYKDSKGFSRIMNVADNKEAMTAATMYKRVLDEWADLVGTSAKKLGWRGDNTDVFSFLNGGFRKVKRGDKDKGPSGDALVQSVLDRKREANPEKYQYLPKKAYTLRRQRATEMLHEDVSLIRIMRLLGHQDLTETAMYFRDIANMGEGSLAFERMQGVKSAYESITDVDRSNLKDKIKRLKKQARAHANEIKSDKRRKGAWAGAADFHEIAAEVGTLFQEGATAKNKAIEWADDSLSSWLRQRPREDYSELGQQYYNFMEQVVALQGIRRMAQEMKITHESLKAQVQSIAKNRRGPTKNWKHFGSVGNKQPTMLERAGYRWNGSTTSPEFVWLGSLKGEDGKSATIRNPVTNKIEQDNALEYWTKRRNDFGDEAGLTELLAGMSPAKQDEFWKSWVSELAVGDNGLVKLSALIDEAKIGKNSKYTVHEALLHHSDTKVLELLTDLDNLDPSVRKAFGDTFEANLKEHVSDDMKNLFNVRHIQNDLTKVLHDMYNNPLGAVYSQTDQAGRNSWNQGWYAGRNKALSVMQASNKLEKLFGKDGVPIHTEADADELGAIAAWLGDAVIQGALKGHRITQKSTSTQLFRALKNMAKRNPALFGSKYAPFYDKGPEAQTLGEDWLRRLGERILRNKDGVFQGAWNDMLAAEKFDFTTLGERLKIMPELRKEIPGTPDRVMSAGSGMLTAGLIVGNILSPLLQSNRIRKEHVQWIHKDSPGAKAVKGVVMPVFAAVAGGRAGLAKPLTKIISGRARSYYDAEYQNGIVRIAFNDLSEQLGMTTDDATEEMLRQGIEKGNQFFGGLKVKDLQEIHNWEHSQEALKKYERYMTGDKTKPGGALTKLMGVTREGEGAFQMLRSETEKYLTQVDMVLERINPEDWEKYFEFAPGQKDNLLFMKSILHNMDKTAAARGVDIVSSITERGGEYLGNYFPRMFRINTSANRKAKDDADGVLNSFAGFFQPRTNVQKDIAVVLGRTMEAGTTADGALLSSAVLEDIGVRAGQYVETMWKTVLDHETIEAITDSTEFIEAVALKGNYAKEISELNNLERLLNARIGGGEISADRIATLTSSQHLDKSKLSLDWKWLVDEGEEGQLIATQRYQDIMNKITVRRLEIDNKWISKQGNEMAGTDWLKSTVEKLSKADQQSINEYLRVEGGMLEPVAAFGKSIRGVTRFMRYMKAGMDMGAPLIHGFNSLVRLPVSTDFKTASAGLFAWGKAFKQMVHFMFSPEAYDRYIIDHMEEMTEASRWIRMGGAGSEPLQAMSGDMLVRVKKTASKYVGEGKHAKFLSRFETGFTGYLDVLRTELWKSMKPSVDRELVSKGLQLSDTSNKLVIKQYHDLGAIINKMTGAMDPELAQQTPYQRLIENSMLFFAPMYRRATYGIIADVMGYGTVHRSGRRFKEGLRQLSGVITAGAMMGQLAEWTGNNDRAFLFDEEGELGEEGALDLSARFGKWNIAGTQTGIGTAWWTAFRLASDIAMNLAYDKGEDEGDSVSRDTWKDHPILVALGRRGRSQLAPGTAILTDLVLGRTFVGDPLRNTDENDWASMARHAGRSVVPFWLDGALSGGNPNGIMVSTTAEFLGLQSYEISSYDKLTHARQAALQHTDIPVIKEWREERIQRKQKVGWIQLPVRLKNIINQEDPTVIGLFKEHVDTFGDRALGNARLFGEYMELKSLQVKKATSDLASASRAWESGEITGRQLQNIINITSYFRREGNARLLESDKFTPLATYFGELRTSAADSDIVFAGDIIYGEWASLVNSDDFIDEDGEWNYHAMKAAEDAFWNMDGNLNYKEYVKERHDDWLKDLPTIRAFESAKETLRDTKYWDIEDTIWEPGSRMNALAKLYLEKPRSLRNSMKEQNNDYRTIDTRIRNARKQMRMRNREVDRILVTWYRNVPQHRLNFNLRDELDEMHNQIVVTGSYATSDPRDFQVTSAGRVRDRNKIPLTRDLLANESEDEPISYTYPSLTGVQ